MDNPVIVWFRCDLRMADNPALNAACESGKPVIALYVLDEKSEGIRPPGAAFKWWLHHSISALAGDMGKAGVQLVLRRGAAKAILDEVIHQSGAEAVFWNRRYGPGERALDTEIKSSLKERGLRVETFNSHLLIEPWDAAKEDGGYYQVFTPFWKHAQSKMTIRPILPRPERLKGFSGRLHSDRLDDWGMLPHSPDWAGGMRAFWTPGEAGAQKRLEIFLREGLAGYAENRDRPDLAEGTSRLSAHLAHGEISPVQIWRAVDALKGRDHPASDKDRQKFLDEVGWREFSYNLLYHFPDLPRRNFKSGFDKFPWEKNESGLHAWQKGRTGYPIVDAGMRQLWQTGWMHNRVRMIVASFLIKDLMVDWREGEAWFWDTLVDADPANNVASWQWVAGSGADAAPYFRIFNPVTQGQRHDPKGDFVRIYVRELERLDEKSIHFPPDAPRHLLARAGVRLGENYPLPIVDHGKAREAALEAYQRIRGNG